MAEAQAEAQTQAEGGAEAEEGVADGACPHRLGEAWESHEVRETAASASASGSGVREPAASVAPASALRAAGREHWEAAGPGSWVRTWWMQERWWVQECSSLTAPRPLG